MKLGPITIMSRKQFDDLTAAAATGEVNAQEAADLAQQRDEILCDRNILAEKHDRLLHNLLAERTRTAELSASLSHTQADLAELRRVEGWLQEAAEHYAQLADAPVEVIVRDGNVFGIQRSREAAYRAVQAVDPDITVWKSVPKGTPPGGWRVSTHQLPEPPRPPHWAEIREHYQFTEPTTEQTETETGPEPDTAPAGCTGLGDRPEELSSHLDRGCRECANTLSDLLTEDLLNTFLTARDAQAPVSTLLLYLELRSRRGTTEAEVPA